MKYGIDRNTGKPLSGIDHVKQSIEVILSTRLSTRVKRRAFGAEIPPLVDNPMNDEFLVDFYAATADAIAAWEPRVQLEEVYITRAEAGVAELYLQCTYDGRELNLPGIIVR